MFIYVQAIDYDRFLRLDVEPDENVRSIKDKISQEMGGIISEEQLDTLNYVGIILDCNTPVRNYGVEESSLLYLGRNPHAPYMIHAPPPTMAIQGQVAAINSNNSQGAKTLTSTQSIAQMSSQPQTLSQQTQLAQQTQQPYYDYQQQSDYAAQPEYTTQADYTAPPEYALQPDYSMQPEYQQQEYKPQDYQPQEYQPHEVTSIAAMPAYQPTAYQQYATGYAAQPQAYFYGYPNY